MNGHIIGLVEKWRKYLGRYNLSSHNCCSAGIYLLQHSLEPDCVIALIGLVKLSVGTIEPISG